MLNIIFIIFVEAQNIENWSPIMEADMLDTQEGLHKLFVTECLVLRVIGPGGKITIAIIQFTYLNHYLLSTYVLIAKLDPKDTEINQVYIDPPSKKCMVK